MLSKFYDCYWREPDLYGMRDLSQDIWTIRRVRMFLDCIPEGYQVVDIGCGTGGVQLLYETLAIQLQG